MNLAEKFMAAFGSGASVVGLFGENPQALALGACTLLLLAFITANRWA